MGNHVFQLHGGDNLHLLLTKDLEQLLTQYLKNQLEFFFTHDGYSPFAELLQVQDAS